MKRVFFLIVVSLFLVQAVFADKKVYTTDTLQLPQTAREFIHKHFPSTGVSHIKIEKEFWEGNQYDVILTNGFDLDFDKNGQWKEIDGHKTALPVSVLLAKIADYLSKNFSGIAVWSIDKDKNGYEVKLANRLELKFNPAQVFVRFDD